MPVTRYQSSSSDLLRPFFEDMLTPFGRMGSSMRVPDTDVIESQNGIRVVTELPGMKPDEVDVSLENNVLTISGEKHGEREKDEETYHLSERRWGRFSRSFVLPREVDQDRIEAKFESGVLTVTIPKSEQARRRRIEIGGSNGGQQVETNASKKAG